MRYIYCFMLMLLFAGGCNTLSEDEDTYSLDRFSIESGIRYGCSDEDEDRLVNPEYSDFIDSIDFRTEYYKSILNNRIGRFCVDGNGIFRYPGPMQTKSNLRIIDCCGYMPRFWSLERMLAIVEADPRKLAGLIGEDRCDRFISSVLDGLVNVGTHNWRILDPKHVVASELSSAWNRYQHTDGNTHKFVCLTRVIDPSKKDMVESDAISHFGLELMAIYGSDEECKRLNCFVKTAEDKEFMSWLCDCVIPTSDELRKDGCVEEFLGRYRDQAILPCASDDVKQLDCELKFIAIDTGPSNIRIKAIKINMREGKCGNRRIETLKALINAYYGYVS